MPPPFADSPAAVSATPLADVDAAIDALDAKKAAWLAVSTSDRAALLDACVASIAKVAPKWADIGARIKGIEPSANLAGEEWIAGIMPTIRNARLLADALRQGGKPRAKTRTRSNGQVVARVFPSSLMDRLMFAGTTADVWIEKGKTASQGAIYSSAKLGDGSVCLVLGGGNVSSIPAMDAFYKLFVENEVVLLKMNPVNEALGPVMGEALAPLVDGGWLKIIYGGAEVGSHAASHAKIGSLHVTGSDRTYDAIVWGGKSKGAGKDRANDKPFSAELGCVTPVIIVPGPWSHKDVRFQARHVAAMVTQNASFNCNAAKVVIIAKEWLQREEFLNALHDELQKTPARKAYYPGAQDRYKRFIEHYSNARVLGAKAEGAVPWTVIPDLGTTASTSATSASAKASEGAVPYRGDTAGKHEDGSAVEYALTNEAFCGVVAELTISAPDFGTASVPKFLEEAVKLANESCWGTLSCCILVHPATEDEHSEHVVKAVENLRYGGIGINAWPGLIYGLVSPTWGAYPGHTAEDIQSGTGVVHNTWMFDHPEKSVIKAPFRIRPTPAWFSDHKNLLDLGKKLVDFESSPTWGKLVTVARAAMKG